MKYLDHLEEWIITFLIGAATLIIFVAVMHRYAAGLPIPGVQDWLIALNLSWAQELCIIMFVWMAKFGAAYGVRTGIHVGVDVLINSLSDSIRARFIVFGLLAGAFFTGIIGALGTGILVNPALGGAGIFDYTAGKIADYDFVTQMIAQFKAVLTTLVWSGVGSAILYKVVDVIVGLRVSVESEREGLDLTGHGERAYTT